MRAILAGSDIPVSVSRASFLESGTNVHYFIFTFKERPVFTQNTSFITSINTGNRHLNVVATNTTFFKKFLEIDDGTDTWWMFISMADNHPKVYAKPPTRIPPALAAFPTTAVIADLDTFNNGFIYIEATKRLYYNYNTVDRVFDRVYDFTPSGGAFTGYVTDTSLDHIFVNLPDSVLEDGIDYFNDGFGVYVTDSDGDLTHTINLTDGAIVNNPLSFYRV